MRARLEQDMLTPAVDWENLLLAAGPENVLLVGFRNPELRRYTGKRLTEVSAERGTSVPATIMDLVIEDSSRVESVYHLMSERNVRRKLQAPWVSIDSDAASLAPEGSFRDRMPHPRAYGSFARLFSKYVRDDKVLTLAEAVHRVTGLPAQTLGLHRRGRVAAGFFADLALFDPEAIEDHATFEAPHQLATGMEYVWVNGVVVLDRGVHTGATPGRVVRGRGFTGAP